MDQVGAPTWSHLLAQVTCDVLKQCILQTDDIQWGLYHLTSAGQTSWCCFAEAIFKQYALQKTPRVIGIPSSEYPTPAKRPAYSVLSNKKVNQAFGVSMPTWDRTFLKNPAFTVI